MYLFYRGAMVLFVCSTNVRYGFYEFCMWYMYGVRSIFPVSSVFGLCCVIYIYGLRLLYMCACVVAYL